MDVKDCEPSKTKVDTPMSNEEDGTTHAMDIPAEERYVIADRPCPPDSVLDPKYLINWYNMSSNTLGEVEARIMLLLSQKEPVFVVCLSYQSFVHEHMLSEIFESIQRIQDKANASGKHRFSPASCMFVPDLHRSWDVFAQFNKWVRQLSINNSIQPLLLHKPLLEKQRSTSVLCVNPSLYVEYLSRSSLGTNLTRDGLRKIINPLVKHITIGMRCTSPLTPKADTASLVPTPPGLTIKYLKSPSLVDHLRELGLFVDQKKGAARSLSRTRPESKRRRTLPPPPPAESRPSKKVNAAKALFPSEASSSGCSSYASCSSVSRRSSHTSEHRRLSEAGAAALAEERRENDLSDCVFYNSLADAGDDESSQQETGQGEKYMRMFTAYGTVLSENHQLKNDLRKLNAQLTDLQKFKKEALQHRDRDLEKQLATYRYYDKCNEREIRILKSDLRDASKRYRELAEQNHELAMDYYQLRDEKDQERKEKEDILESRRHLEEMYDKLLSESKEERGQNERRKKKKGKKSKGQKGDREDN